MAEESSATVPDAALSPEPQLGARRSLRNTVRSWWFGWSPRRRAGLIIGVGTAVLLVLIFTALWPGDQQPSTAASDIDTSLGLTAGTVIANDRGKLTVAGVLGGIAVVRTDHTTHVFVPAGAQVSDVRAGDTVIVIGGKTKEGVINANFILGNPFDFFGG
ncbi:hypothetical protein ACFYO1_02530 [Nocardia sp. NPDC006044]|uniref:hypothetical protein n=1 Tax=Nocardia sp. NPDC006044 TaxID=3364306 RepID=UPI0036CA93A2